MEQVLNSTDGMAWRKRAALMVAAVLVASPLGSLGAGTAAAGVGAATSPLSVIVRALPGDVGRAEAQVSSLGGRIARRLGIINGFSASVPGSALGKLRASAGIVSVTPDVAVHLASLTPTTSTVSSTTSTVSPTTSASSPTTSTTSPTTTSVNTGTLSAIETITQAQKAWAQNVTGAGVDVALLDSGVAPVPGLNDPAKVLNGPDLSFDSQLPGFSYLDAYGHGTHMASIIAGHDTPNSTAGAVTDGDFKGMAPGARIVNVKVGAANGVVDVSQVIAGIDWIVQHRADKGMNIRVLNLSFGTDSAQPYVLDPLAFASEVAWNSGIVVVVAAGNGGNNSAIEDPASDPYVLAVGADDPGGSLDPRNGTVASFSSAGSATRHVDVIAPGAHVLGLRDPGGYLDTTYPSAEVGKRLFLGSGTSQATAVVSGAAALLAQQFPGATPDQIKGLLMATAVPVTGASAQLQGSGVIQVHKALKAGIAAGPTLAAMTQAWVPSTGAGSLEATRGSDHVTSNGVALSGEQDIFSQPFDSTTMAAAEAAGSSWSGGMWNGSSWSGSSWSGSSWSGSSWSGSSWSGSSWSGSSWSGSSWSGSSWSGSSWSGSSWSGSSWSGSSWSGGSWSDSGFGDSGSSESCLSCALQSSPLGPTSTVTVPGTNAVGVSGDRWN